MPSVNVWMLATDGHHDQSELEHRTSKARFLRTNGRSIPLQLSKIERRQRYIRAIRGNMHGSPTQSNPEDIVDDPHAQYCIGKTQNSPVHIPTFLQKNEGDPAINVSGILSLVFLCGDVITIELLPEIEAASTSSHARTASARSHSPPGEI
jgi:hypothetical protein